MITDTKVFTKVFSQSRRTFWQFLSFPERGLSLKQYGRRIYNLIEKRPHIIRRLAGKPVIEVHNESLRKKERYVFLEASFSNCFSLFPVFDSISFTDGHRIIEWNGYEERFEHLLFLENGHLRAFYDEEIRKKIFLKEKGGDEPDFFKDAISPLKAMKRMLFNKQTFLALAELRAKPINNLGFSAFQSNLRGLSVHFSDEKHLNQYRDPRKIIYILSLEQTLNSDGLTYRISIFFDANKGEILEVYAKNIQYGWDG